MKRIAYILGLLGINFVVTLLAVLAFFLFIFGGDPILAAMPAVLAAPVILLQPWFFLFIFLPYGHHVAPVLTTAISVLVYRQMNHTGMLEWSKNLLKSRKTLVAVGGYILVISAVAVARYYDFPALRYGIPPSLSRSDILVTNSRYFCLGSFIDSEWLWQARIPESELDRLVANYHLQPVDRELLPGEFMSMRPYWWKPSVRDGTRIFSTSDFPKDKRGPDGWHTVAVWNPDDEILYMWIKDNF